MFNDSVICTIYNELVLYQNIMDILKKVESLLDSMFGIIYKRINKKCMHKIWKLLDRQNNIHEKRKYF